MNEHIKWIARIEDWARKRGLDFYPQEFIFCNKEKMLENLAHYGGYKLYRSWKFGKAYSLNKTLLDRNFFFLPYEMVINTNPCRAFILESNALIKNILIMPHVFAHNDFSKNNCVFKKTNAADIERRLEKQSRIVDRHIANPKIGIEKVEEVIEAAHSVMFLETDEGTLLDFILKHALWLKAWKTEVVDAVKLIADHLQPNLQTKIMNEGWATYWHHKMLEELGDELDSLLSYKQKFAGYEFHDQVIRLPAKPSEINPYRVGFCIWQKIAEEKGEKHIFEVRQNHVDFTFLMDYFCGQYEMTYEKFIRPGVIAKEMKEHPGLKPADILPLKEREDGCKEYQEMVMDCVRSKNRPKFAVIVQREGGKNNLILNHQVEGSRFLKRNYIDGALRLIHHLWEDPVVLNTRVKETNNNQIIIKECSFTYYRDGAQTKKDYR